eukprot:2025058-Prymnesium_polylepis.1
MEITRELISYPCPVRFPPPRALDGCQRNTGIEFRYIVTTFDTYSTDAQDHGSERGKAHLSVP